MSALTGLHVSTTHNSEEDDRRNILFRFRSRPAEWFTLVAFVVGIVALVVTALLWIDSRRLVIWEAEKDYRAYCEVLEAKNKHLPNDGSASVHGVLYHPPFPAKDFFIDLSDNSRQELQCQHSARGTSNF